MNDTIVKVGAGALRIEDVDAVALGRASVDLEATAAFQGRFAAGVAFLDALLADSGAIYGVTTGYGDSCTTTVPLHLVEALPRQLVRFLGCGLGAYLDDTASRAVMLARLVSLSQGYSGVRWLLLDRLAQLLNHQVTPLIPAEGSVGASGDLVPLSYVAAVLMGERTVRYQGTVQPSSAALAAANLEPLTLRPKEALALVNGTAMMTGLAALGWMRAAYLLRLCTRLTAVTSVALGGNPHHFSARLFDLKPHPGQQQVAAWLRQDLDFEQDAANAAAAAADVPAMRLQDRYSLRCAPQIAGVLADALPWLRQLIEQELNSANDNPLIDAEAGTLLHGGHFYGGHIACAMDTLKTLVANLADLMDRQLAQLVDPKFNHGLPANLSGAIAEQSSINHGFKAVQIAASAWTAEALKLTMPASVFSRSTECHNQDKVSMGSIAARDCLRIIELTEQVAAALILVSTQALSLRLVLAPHTRVSPPLTEFRIQVAAQFAPLQNDRALDADLRQMVRNIQARHFDLYEQVEP